MGMKINCDGIVELIMVLCFMITPNVSKTSCRVDG
jgi:hypothetical protein